MATLADRIADGSVRHVIILMLENRSFDEYFGTFPGANGFYTMSAAEATQTFMAPPLPGTETPYLPARLSSFTRALGWPAMADCNHIWDGQHTSWANGAMNGWQQPFEAWLNNSAGCVGYYLQNDIPYHWSLAQNFVLCDAYHCSVLGPTEPNRMYLFAGTCVDPSIPTTPGTWPQASDPRAFMGGFVSSPSVTAPEYGEPPNSSGTSNWVPPTFKSYADYLTENGTTWKVYDLQADGEPYDQPGLQNQLNPQQPSTGDLNLMSWFPTTWATMFPNGFPMPPDALNSEHYVRGNNDGGGLAQLASDVNNHSAATPFPTVSWIIPEYGFSEHPTFVPWDGAALISDVVTILLQGLADVWNSTVLIVTYDENDGHYDHVPPVVPSPTVDLETTTAPPPQSSTQPGANQAEFLLDDTGNYQPIGSGFRVPTFVISPWTFNAPQNICSTLFDHTSIIRFLEDLTQAHCPNISAWRRQNFSSLSAIPINPTPLADAATILTALQPAAGHASSDVNTGTIQAAANARQTNLFATQGNNPNGDFGWPLLPFPPLTSPPAWPPVAQSCTVIVTIPSYSQADVAFQAGSNANATFGAAPSGAALLVIVDGFEPVELNTPYALATTTTLPLTGDASHMCTTRVPTVSFVDAQGLPVPGLTATAQSVDLDPGDPSVQTPTGVPQRFTFSFSVTFSDNFLATSPQNIFPASAGAIQRYTVNAAFAVDTTVTSRAEIECLSSDDPQFYHNFYDDVPYLSGELRVFSVGGGQTLFGATLGDPSDPAGATAENAIDFIQNVITNLNSGASYPAEPLNAGATVVQVATFDDLPQDETTNPLPLYGSRNGIPVYNFALARVHMNAQTNATNVRVFFRSFRAAVTTSAFDPVSDFTTGSQFRSNPPAGVMIGENDTRTPLLGVLEVANAAGHSVPEYVTIPFFASTRANLLSPPQTMMQQTDPYNTITIQGNPANSTTEAYFGCWLDINQSTALFPAAPPVNNWDGPWPSNTLQPIQQAFKNDLHQCLVAEISFYQISIPAGDTPSLSAWLAQRNLGLVSS